MPFSDYISYREHLEGVCSSREGGIYFRYSFVKLAARYA